MPPPTPPRIFDRALINRRLDRAWARAGGDAGADFLLTRAAQDLGERLSLVKRRFALQALSLVTQMAGGAVVLIGD